MKNKISTIACLIAATFALAACGGGGSNGSTTASNGTSSPTGVTATDISGTAAAGTAIVGTVTLLDSRGTRKTAPIRADGSFTLDTAGLQGPFLLRATGSAAGTAVTLHAAATTDDLGRTINITPLTDLIVANIAGAPATTLFDAPVTDLSAITTGALNNARDILAVRLRPILDGMGIAAGFDLLRSPFKADHSGLDGALDLLKVSIDPDRGQAIITSRASGQSIVDNLGSLSDTDALPPIDGNALKAAVSDLNAISAVMNQFNAALRYTVPTGAALDAFKALFDDDFLLSGKSLANALSLQYFLSPYLTGMNYSDPTIVSRSADGNTVRVRFHLTAPKILYENYAAELSFHKDSSGRWLIQGDRQIGDIAPYVLSLRNMQPNGVYTYERYVEFWIDSAPSLGATRAVLQGPGLPTISTDIPGLETVEGVLLRRSTDTYSTEMFAPADESADESVVHLPLCADQPASSTRCLDESRIQANSVYTVTFLNASNQIIGEPARISLVAPPLTTAQMAATPEKWFATFTRLTPSTSAALLTAADISASWTLPTSAGFTASYISLSGDALYEDAELLPNATSWSLGRGLRSISTLNAEITITVQASGGREFKTGHRYP